MGAVPKETKAPAVSAAVLEVGGRKAAARAVLVPCAAADLAGRAVLVAVVREVLVVRAVLDRAGLASVVLKVRANRAARVKLAVVVPVAGRRVAGRRVAGQAAIRACAAVGPKAKVRPRAFVVAPVARAGRGLKVVPVGRAANAFADAEVPMVRRLPTESKGQDRAAVVHAAAPAVAVQVAGREASGGLRWKPDSAESCSIPVPRRSARC